MAYFPAFIELKGSKILIVGGGNIAYDKCSHLLDFTDNIEIISENFSNKMSALINNNNLKFKTRKYIKKDAKKFDIVIVAVDDLELQKKIYQETREYPKCLCNSVDSPKYCDFIFPSYVKKGDLTIAISTSGSSPALAKHIRIYLQNIIPESINDFLTTMKKYRKSMTKGKSRMKFLDKKAKEFIKSSFKTNKSI